MGTQQKGKQMPGVGKLSVVTTTAFIVFLHSVTGIHATIPQYYGTIVGSFRDTAKHGVSGTLYIVDHQTLFIRDFSYDGKGIDVHFRFGSSGSVSANAKLIPVNHNSTENLRQYYKEGVLLRMPKLSHVWDISWLSIWDRARKIDLDSVQFPPRLRIPWTYFIGKFGQYSPVKHGVRSSIISFTDSRTIRITQFNYDGTAPDAYFMVGKGEIIRYSEETSLIIPDEIGSTSSLRKYIMEDITIRAPPGTNLADYSWLSVYSKSNKESLSHVPIPPLMTVPPNLEDLRGSDDCLDVAVIGAGISGSYSAWRLRNMYRKISVFEYSDRIGGKLYTRRFPNGAKVEFGSMRFLRLEHRDLADLVDELKLTTVLFEGQHSAEDSIYYLRRTRRRLNESATMSDFPGYYVKPEEKPKSVDDLSSMIYKGTVDGKHQNSSDPMQFVTRGGELLRNIGLVNMMGRHVSLEARAFMRDISGFNDYSVNSNAAFLGPPPDVLPTTNYQDDEFSTVAEGMQAVVEGLITNFLTVRATNTLHKNHMLKSIQTEGPHLQLRFRKTKTVGFETLEMKDEVTLCARKVILAIPARPLEMIDWPPLYLDRQLHANMRSYLGSPALKFYLMFDKPWWRQYSVRSIITDLPLRQTMEFSVSKDSSVILASYNDVETVGYWRGLLVGEKSEVNLPNTFNVTKKLIDHALMYMAEAIGIQQSSIPAPTGAAIQFWEDDPVGHAWYTIMPGFDWHEVRDRMSKPDPSHDVHVVSTYGLSEEPWWADGAIKIAKYTLEKHFCVN